MFLSSSVVATESWLEGVGGSGPKSGRVESAKGVPSALKLS